MAGQDAGKERSTRDRLVDEGMRLFAAQGFRATTIRQIEAAVGLVPGRGAFYRHFASKDELFATCLDLYRTDILRFGEDISEPGPEGDVRAELEHLVRGTLALLARQRPLLALLSREPTDPAGTGAGDGTGRIAAVQELLVREGYRNARTVFRRLLEANGQPAEAARVRAVAAIALGSIVHFREDEAVYGTTPAGATEAAFVRTWVDVWEAYLTRGGAPRGGD
jgi:AcrR family transcriptional regulator